MKIDPTRRLKSEIEAAEETRPLRLLLSANKAAKALSISPRTLWSLTSPRGPIPAVRLPGRVLYSRAALEKWIAEAERAGTTEKGGPDDD